MANGWRIQVGFVAGTVAFLLCLCLASSVEATRESRPFWTEKSAFVEGDELFVVGVASRARSMEEGRKLAFENGKIELMNFAQITNLEAQGLVIETQMTYEEANTDGTVTVFRLLRAPAKKLIEIQNRVQAQTRTQEQSLDQARRELAATQESVLQKQQELETRGKELETAVGTVSRLQVTLGEKALKIEQHQKQVEQLLQQLSLKVSQAKPTQRDVVPRRDLPPSSLLEVLKETEAQLDAQAQELKQIAARARERIKSETDNYQKRCLLLYRGMTPAEVRQLMGEPWRTFNDRTLSYGRGKEISIGFNHNGGLDHVNYTSTIEAGCGGR